MAAGALISWSNERGIPMKTKTIKQTVTLAAPAHEIYEMLMDSKKHAAFTGDDAEISREVGGKISAWGGYIGGTNLELVPDRKIVQSWRGSDWPEGHYSRVTFQLRENGGFTTLSFEQTGVPEAVYDDVAQGWRDYYWKPMRKTLKGKKKGKKHV
jgi:activator of HSP90 ATPase